MVIDDSVLRIIWDRAVIRLGLELFWSYILNQLDFEIFENLCFLLSEHLINREIFSTIIELVFSRNFFPFHVRKLPRKFQDLLGSIFFKQSSTLILIFRRVEWQNF